MEVVGIQSLHAPIREFRLPHNPLLVSSEDSFGGPKNHDSRAQLEELERCQLLFKPPLLYLQNFAYGPFPRTKPQSLFSMLKPRQLSTSEMRDKNIHRFSGEDDINSLSVLKTRLIRTYPIFAMLNCSSRVDVTSYVRTKNVLLDPLALKEIRPGFGVGCSLE